MQKTLTMMIAALFLSMSTLAPAHSIGKKIVVANVGFATPESVEYFAAEDVYLVTNINGDPFAADGNGFISKVRPDGSIIDLKWIDGMNPGTTLHAPKGAVVSGNLLYVADRDQIHIFDLPSGKQRSSITIKGSTFLNGITAAADGNIYITDTGLIPGFKPSGTDAIYRLRANGTYQALINDNTLGGPNGIIVNGGKITVVSFGSGEVFEVDQNGKKNMIPKPATGALDGLLQLSDGRLIMSSWGGSSVLALNPDASYSVIADHLDAPADMGFDPKRNRVLIPLFKKNELVFLSL